MLWSTQEKRPRQRYDISSVNSQTMPITESMSISFTAAKYIRRPVKVGCRIQTYHEKARVLKVHLLKKLRGYFHVKVQFQMGQNRDQTTMKLHYAHCFALSCSYPVKYIRTIITTNKMPSPVNKHISVLSKNIKKFCQQINKKRKQMYLSLFVKPYLFLVR